MITTIEIYYHYYITIVHIIKCTKIIHSNSLHRIRREEEENQEARKILQSGISRWDCENAE